MDWCGSSTPRTPEYRTMNEERHERKAYSIFYWLLIVRPQFLTGRDTKGLRPPHPIEREGRAFAFFVLSKSCTMKIDGEYLIELIGSCRNKVQV